MKSNSSSYPKTLIKNNFAEKSVKRVKMREEVFLYRHSYNQSFQSHQGWLYYGMVGLGYMFKRFFDWTLAFILILGLSPLFVLIFVLIRLDSYGCAFYGEKRIGKDGEIFRLYQFRIFHTRMPYYNFFRFFIEGEEGDKKNFLQFYQNQEFTRVGKWLYRFRLNHLPKLFNILLGDMSFLGPNPWTVEEARCYSLSNRAQLHLKPGLAFLGNPTKIREYLNALPNFRERKHFSQLNWVQQIFFLLKISLSIFLGRVAY